MPLDVDALVAGPRGRRLCLEYARLAAPPLAVGGTFGWAGQGSGGDALAATAQLLADVPVEIPPELVDAALLRSVRAAMYWQRPDDDDRLAASPDLKGPLARVAHLLVGSPSVAWWSSPMADQQWVTWFDGTTRPPVGGRQALAEWSARVRQDEVDARRGRSSGSWWSTPVFTSPSSTRALDGQGPVRLRLVEDGLGWTGATALPLSPPVDAVVYTVDTADAWAELCRRYPLEVTASRGHSWDETTRVEGRWVIPDWAAVAEQFDAVHVSVAGYLATAGRALAVTDELSTVLAGWDPDATFWLGDVRVERDAAETWVLVDPHGGRWHRES